MTNKQPRQHRYDLPYLPAPYDKRIVLALQALNAGEASKDQQKAAITYIVETLSNYLDLSYRPDTHDTAFAEGRRYVGAQIMKMMKLNPSEIK